ncbi:MAG: hypothetical protein ABJF04_23765 [Reichenbachiella sp.]|uniref:hypothetical protein n=1 Tax=Reichenbachiella sp. TaxID=2184521 RepID=UPI0032644E08
MRTFLLLLLLSFQGAKAQTYTIIHVIGKIHDSSTNTYLRPGAKLAESSKLKFETPNARAAALSSSRGRYVIQQQDSQNQSGDFAYTLASVLAPARGKMSTRSGGINNQMDFVKKFGEGPVAIINGTYEVAISPNSYPTDAVHFFYASYLFNQESINKKLDVINGQLVIDAKSFYAVDDIPIDPSETSETKLFYYNSDKQESTEITTLDLVLVSSENLGAIKKLLGEMSEEEQIAAIQDILTSMYGKCDAKQIQIALQTLN